MTAQPNPDPLVPPAAAEVRTIAVINIGANSVRVNVAELHPDGSTRSLEELHQQASLGQDVFKHGTIRSETVKQVVAILKKFSQALKQYGVTRPDQIRAVATSAVREARNREAFLDRTYIATNIEIAVIDEAEETRLTYQSILPYLDHKSLAGKRNTLVAEVGGGNTEILLLRGKDVLHSHNYRLGALRLREMLENYSVPDARQREMMESQIARTISQLTVDIPFGAGPNVIALGSEMRLAAARLAPDWDARSLVRLSVAALSNLVDDTLSRSVDDLVRRYRLLYPEAETLGPTLLTYLKLCRACRARHIFVTKATMRDGLLADLSSAGAWSDAFFAQIVRSAIELGRKYEFDEAHARQVAELAAQLFAALKPEHQLDDRHGKLLHIAAILHEIGVFVGSTGHHKHSMYLIMNSELFGLGKRDLTITALIARYHRRASPQPAHAVYNTLTRDERICVAKLAAILRIADALERSHGQRISAMTCTHEENRLVIGVDGVDELGLERLALRQKGAMFTEVFGMDVDLRRLNRPRPRSNAT